MAGSTTYRGELPDASRKFNRGAILTIGDGAGTNPKNPIAAGMGMTIVVRGSSSTVSVTGLMRYDLDPTGASASSIAFTQSPTQQNTWTASGAAGGLALGFPFYLDYDTPKPFTLIVRVSDQRGDRTESYTFWVGSAAEHALESDCHTREGFSALVQNCCYDGQGFRLSEARFGVFGPYDAFFDTAIYVWAVGTDYFTNGAITKVCNPNRDLLNPYIPDSISGVVSNPPQPDNPFVVPASAAAPQVVPYDVLGAAQRLTPDVDATAAQYGLVVTPVTTPPADPDGNNFVNPPGYRTLTPGMYPPPTPPDSKATGARRAQLDIIFPNQPAGEQTYFDRDIASPMQFTLSGMQGGELVYFFANGSIADFSGEEAVIAAPHGYEGFFSGEPLVFDRETSGAVAVSPLVSRLNIPDLDFGPVLAAELAPWAITGGTTWTQTSLGGVATIDAGLTTLTFSIPMDATAINQAGAIRMWLRSGVDSVPAFSAAFVVQGIVCRPGTAPSGGGGSFGTVWPQSAYLTNPVILRMRD